MNMSGWTKCDPAALEENPFVLFNDKWVLIAAEKEGKVNAMTASWGGLGVLWNEQVATVYVRESRYTHGFLEAADTFSLTVYDESYQKMLFDVMGRKSGRDTDKIKESGLTLSRLDGTPVFEQARLAFVCEKLYRQSFCEEGFCNRAYHGTYADGDYHTIYIGKIKALYQK